MSSHCYCSLLHSYFLPSLSITYLRTDFLFFHLQTRKLYFVTESALYELFKIAAEHSDEIIDTLNEEGLTIPAAQFDQVRKALSSWGNLQTDLLVN